MKKFITDIRVFGMLFITTATMISCSSDNDIVEEQHPDEPQVYTMTVQASKGGNTRALSLDGSTLNATWTEGDAVQNLLQRLATQDGIMPPERFPGYSFRTLGK